MCTKHEFPKGFVGNCKAYTIFTAVKSQVLEQEGYFVLEIFFEGSHHFLFRVHLSSWKAKTEQGKRFQNDSLFL